MVQQQQKVVVLEAYFSTKSYKRCIEIFLDVGASGKSTVYDLVVMFCETDLLEDSPRNDRSSILTPDFLQDVQLQLQHSPHKSLQQLSQKVNQSYSACQRVTKCLKPRAYRVPIVE